MDKFLSRKRTFNDNKASTSAHTSIVPKIKSRKYSQEYLNFGFTITEVNGEEKPLCVICSKILAADSMKPNKLIKYISKRFMSIPLSNGTVSRRIDYIAGDVEQQLFGKLRDKLFSIQLDEATDSNKDVHFIAYVRFWDGMSVVEELLFCKPIKHKATAIALFDILNNFINEANIDWKNCVGICTDGARTMSERFKSIQALVKQKSPLCIWTHCMIHREALASKEMSPGLNIVLMTVVTVVNYIK
ncbi:zinc finger MYM-type protein 6 [Trichonephila clavipes]|uniref:Zinc finger MYM-type protein 6 n=1 Tax=Trichonephila clavipes TaxID=2585209 RepID=A0A8X6WCU0_TRICX|nr:zinc finger MYM-type protein 6 [Trichonephila clavipes]